MTKKKTITEITKNPVTGTTVVQEIPAEDSNVPAGLDALADQFHTEAPPEAPPADAGTVPPPPGAGPAPVAAGTAEDRRGRGRPKGSRTRNRSAQAEETPTADDLRRQEQARATFSALGGILYDITVEAINTIPAKPAERELFAQTGGAVIDKWMPRAGAYAEELAFLLVAGSVVLPRLVEWRKRKIDAQREAEKKKAAAPALPPTVQAERDQQPVTADAT